MGLRIGTNVASLTAQRNLQQATTALRRNFLHLSTGKRIARAGDDAAGLAISARLNKERVSLDQAVRNANDGVSLVNTAEGSMAEISDTLVRMRQLAVQSENGTLSASDRDALQTEFAELRSTIDQIANTTSFNDISLLNQSGGTVELQVGSGTTTNDKITINLTSVTSSDLSLSSLDIGSTGDASAAIAAIDTALDAVSTSRASFGAAQNRLDVAISNVQIRSENLAAANSRIQDVDVAFESAQLTKNSILQQAAISVLAQANLQPQAALSLIG